MDSDVNVWEIADSSRCKKAPGTCGLKSSRGGSCSWIKRWWGWGVPKSIFAFRSGAIGSEKEEGRGQEPPKIDGGARIGKRRPSASLIQWRYIWEKTVDYIVVGVIYGEVRRKGVRIQYPERKGGDFRGKTSGIFKFRGGGDSLSYCRGETGGGVSMVGILR